jgi:hypothetical protein
MRFRRPRTSSQIAIRVDLIFQRVLFSLDPIRLGFLGRKRVGLKGICNVRHTTPPAQGMPDIDVKSTRPAG